MRFKQLALLSASLVIVACGQEHTPIALKAVNPLLGEDGNFDRPVFQPEAVNTTLLNEAVKQGVPQAVATVGFTKYDQFAKKVKNTKYLSIIDFTQYSGHSRFYMINTSTGHVDALLVAHGSGSDPSNTGYATKFSNTPNSKETSLGSYLVSETFTSSVHGLAARLDGLESTNSYARARAIIMHSASYVTTARSMMGRSWGCPALSMAWISTALSRLPGGSFMYAYGVQHSTPADELNESQLRGMMLDPSYQWTDESAAPLDGAAAD